MGANPDSLELNTGIPNQRGHVMTLKTKLTVGFIVTSAIATAIAFIGYIQIHRLAAADTKMYVSIVKPLAQLEAIATSFQRQRVNVRDILSHSDGDTREEFVERLEELDKEIQQTADSYEKTLYSDEGKKLFKEFRQAYQNYEASESALLTLVKKVRQERQRFYWKATSLKQPVFFNRRLIIWWHPKTGKARFWQMQIRIWHTMRAG